MDYRRGFTLIEVIAVLMLIGFLGVVITSRGMNSQADLIAETDLLKSNLRYAQSRAMSSNTVWGVNLSGNTYSLFKNGNVSDKVPFPGEEVDTRSLPSGISVETAVISFDYWGIPYTNAAASDGQELVSGDVEAEITVSSLSNSRTITITPNTGFIP